MRINIGIIWLLLVVMGLLPAPAIAQDSDLTKNLTVVPIKDAPSFAKRALIIGVSKYEEVRPLTVPANDARNFAKLLETRFNFPPEAIVLMTDDPETPEKLRPTHTHMRTAINTLLSGVTEKSEVVIFFSGHGTRDNDEDWLVPIDGDPTDVADSCISYDKIKQRLDTKRPHRALLIVDACRNLRSGKDIASSGFGGNAKTAAGPQIAELLSCQPTEVSQEGRLEDFTESVFTHFLIQGLRGDPEALDPGTNTVTFDSLKVYVQGKVSQYVSSKLGQEQNPDGRATLGAMVLMRVDKGDGSTPEVATKTPRHGVAAIVNGEEITIATVRQLAFKRYGDSVRAALAQERLIETEASSKSVVATEKEIDAKIAEVRKTIASRPGQTLESALSQAHMTMADLRDLYGMRVKLDKLVAKAGGKVTAVDYISNLQATRTSPVISDSLTMSKAYQQYGSQMLKQLIQQVLIDQEAKGRNIEVTEDEIDAEVSKVTKTITSRPGVTLESALKQANMTMADLRLLYRGRIKLEKMASATVTPSKLVHIRHILVTTANPANAPDIIVHSDDEALALVAKIQADLQAGRKFEDVAADYSEDKQTKDKGGDLGIAGPTSPYDKTFLAAALALETGEVTKNPVKSIYGYHIIKADSTSDTATGDEKALYTAAIEKDKQEQTTQASTKLLADLQAKAVIENFIGD